VFHLPLAELSGILGLLHKLPGGLDHRFLVGLFAELQIADSRAARAAARRPPSGSPKGDRSGSECHQSQPVTLTDRRR
jgi:hypothetical protein